MSIELDPDRTALARVNLERAGLDSVVELRIEDTGETLAGSPDDAWAFISLDAERPAYPGHLPDIVRTPAPCGVLAVDNVISHEDELDRVHVPDRGGAGARAHVGAIGAGIMLALAAAS